MVRAPIYMDSNFLLRSVQTDIHYKVFFYIYITRIKTQSDGQHVVLYGTVQQRIRISYVSIIPKSSVHCNERKVKKKKKKATQRVLSCIKKKKKI